MAESIYFIHPLRDNVSATMTDEEKVVWAVPNLASARPRPGRPDGGPRRGT